MLTRFVCLLFAASSLSGCSEAAEPASAPASDEPAEMALPDEEAAEEAEAPPAEPTPAPAAAAAQAAPAEGVAASDDEDEEGAQADDGSRAQNDALRIPNVFGPDGTGGMRGTNSPRDLRVPSLFGQGDEPEPGGGRPSQPGDELTIPSVFDE